MPLEQHSFELVDEAEPERILRGRVDSPAGAEGGDEAYPVVLVLHGFKGFMDWGFFPELSQHLASRGIVSVRFNMSGSGVGEDPERITEDEAFACNTPTRELEDTETLRAFLQSGALPWVDANRVGILGHSLGGGISLLHAAEHGDLRAVVTWAAISRVDRYGTDAVEAWRRDGFLPVPNARTGQTHRLGECWLDDVEAHAAELDIVGACRRLGTPTLLVHGTADEAVALAEAETLAEAFPAGVARTLFVEGAGHTFGATHPPKGAPADLARVLEATIAHFVEHLTTV